MPVFSISDTHSPAPPGFFNARKEGRNMSTGTIVRTAVLLLALINQILTGAGLSPLPIADEHIEQAFSLAFTIAASVWAWWKNNSVTASAIEADEHLKKMRNA